MTFKMKLKRIKKHKLHKQHDEKQKKIKKMLNIIILLLFFNLIYYSILFFSFEVKGKNIDEEKFYFTTFTPKDRVKENQIKVYEDKIIIELKNAEWSRFKNTGSMKPFLDENANAIEIKPKNKTDLRVGDIISYTYYDEKTEKNITIIHRIIKISEDKKGWYAITKGDNNKTPDPKKVRFSQIKRVLVAIIY